MDAIPLLFGLNLSDDARVLLVIGILLAVGVLGSELCKRLLRLPAITGCILTGLAVGPLGLNLLTADALNEFRFIVDIALGMILFELGRRIDIVWLLRERWLLATGLLAQVLIFTVLYLLLTSIGVSGLLAAMAATIGITSSPAVALLLVRELRAEGQLTERMLHLTALSNVTAFLLFGGWLTTMQIQQDPPAIGAWFEPALLFGLSVLLGWLAAKLLVRLGTVLSDRQTQFRALILAMIMLLLGIGHWLGFSALLALLVFGLASRIGNGQLLVHETDLAPIDALLCIVLFVYSGAQLTFEFLHQYLWLALLFILLRSGMAVAATGLMTWLNGISLSKGLWLGLSLYPMSGIASVLMLHTAAHYPEFGQPLSALLASVLGILELSGPLVLRLALRASGEAHS